MLDDVSFKKTKIQAFRTSKQDKEEIFGGKVCFGRLG